MKYLIGVVLIITVLFGQAQESNFSRPDLPGELMVDVGINTWSAVPDTLNRKGWASKSIGIYYSKRHEIGRKLSFYSGLGLTMEKMGFNGNTSLSDSSTYIYETPFDGVSKNKLAATYLEIPVEFRFHPRGTDEGEGLFFGVGGMIGLRMNSHTKWKYEQDGGKKTHKISGDFNLEDLRYGYQIRFGFRGVHLFYKRYLSKMFRNPIEGADPNMATIGINLTGF